jgi:hypothetical protein
MCVGARDQERHRAFFHIAKYRRRTRNGRGCLFFEQCLVSAFLVKFFRIVVFLIS